MLEGAQKLLGGWKDVNLNKGVVDFLNKEVKDIDFTIVAGGKASKGTAGTTSLPCPLPLTAPLPASIDAEATPPPPPPPATSPLVSSEKKGGTYVYVHVTFLPLWIIV